MHTNGLEFKFPARYYVCYIVHIEDAQCYIYNTLGCYIGRYNEYEKIMFLPIIY